MRPSRPTASGTPTPRRWNRNMYVAGMPTPPGVATPANSAEAVVKTASRQLIRRPPTLMSMRIRQELNHQLTTISSVNKRAAHQERRSRSLNWPNPPSAKGTARLKPILAASSQSQDFFRRMGLASVAAALRLAAAASGGRGGVAAGISLHCRLGPPRTASATPHLIPSCAPRSKKSLRSLVARNALPEERTPGSAPTEDKLPV